MKEDCKGSDRCTDLKVPINETIGRSLGNESLEVSHFIIAG